MCLKKKNANKSPKINDENQDNMKRNIPNDLYCKVNRLLDNVENGATVILIEDAADVDSLKGIATKGVFGAVNGSLDYNLTVLSEMIDCCLNLGQQYTSMFDDMSKMILKTGELALFMRMNALNEAAIIKECGNRHFLFNTDWKETIWRKKVVKAASRYLYYADKDYLDKTVRYIAFMLSVGDFSLNVPNDFLKQECNSVITINATLCHKFNLDSSTIENTNNPFDSF